MKLSWHGYSPPVLLILAFMASLGLSACDGDDGAAGAAGAAGLAGSDGADGISCWDLNQNGVRDLPDEDINGDGVVDVLDCSATSSGDYEGAQLHKGYFTDHAYEGTESCLNCHGPIGDEIIDTGHFKWNGVASNIEGFESGFHGKKDIINNFCIAIASNEGRCTQCHIGYGYKDASFDFSDPDNVDCLVCHDQTGTYAKAPTTAGLPADGVDLTLVAQSVAENSGVPTIDNCIFCHARAGGDDNVKHGDLAMSLANTTKEFDVHMGTAESGGADLECVACHQVKKDGDDNVLSHGIGGMPYHSVDEGEMESCEDCHGDRYNRHIGTTAETIINLGPGFHDKLACQACHIPTFARNQSTKTEWYWQEAGQDIAEEDIPIIAGRKAYNKKKGRFVWANNVRPTLRYFNGKYNKVLVGENDQYTSLPAVLAEPVGDYTDPNAMIYPFKKMIGNQPADANNNTILVPHLFGTAGGPNPYWGKYDWNLALVDGAAAAGQTYTGAYEFVNTEMYLSVNHEVAPKEQAYGMDNACGDCHFGDQINWQGLGWSGDPVSGGTRP